MRSRSHKDLLVWSKARELVVALYRVSASFPVTERFGLTAQTRRAAISILSNISEGAARGSDKEFLQFLSIARGSLAELEAQMLIACDLGLVAAEDSLCAEIAEVGRMVNGLIAAIRSNSASLANSQLPTPNS